MVTKKGVVAKRRTVAFTRRFSLWIRFLRENGYDREGRSSPDALGTPRSSNKKPVSDRQRSPPLRPCPPCEPDAKVKRASSMRRVRENQNTTQAHRKNTAYSRYGTHYLMACHLVITSRSGMDASSCQIADYRLAFVAGHAHDRGPFVTILGPSTPSTCILADYEDSHTAPALLFSNALRVTQVFLRAVLAGVSQKRCASKINATLGTSSVVHC